jgi:hypothetical protein
MCGRQCFTETPLCAQTSTSVSEDPSSGSWAQPRGRRFKRFVKKPRDRCEIAVHSAQFPARIKFEIPVPQPAANTIPIWVDQCLLVSPGATAMCDGAIERSEVGERGRFALVRRLAQVVVETAMRGPPCHFISQTQPLRRTIRAPADERRALPDRRGRPARAAAHHVIARRRAAIDRR